MHTASNLKLAASNLKLAFSGRATRTFEPSLAQAFAFSTADAPESAPGSRGPNLWSSQFAEVTDAADSSLRGWVKYDAHSLYFGFEVLDDYLHGIDGPRWCPAGNPACEQLTPQGWPWFGDGVEVLINAAGRQHAVPVASTVVGNSTQWQMVCSLTKSRLGGVGKAGLCEGEPRQSHEVAHTSPHISTHLPTSPHISPHLHTSPHISTHLQNLLTSPYISLHLPISPYISSEAWHTYRRWIETGAMRCAAQPRRSPRGFVLEFAVRFALLQLSPGRPYHMGMPHTPLGLNLALSDVDRRGQGDPTFGFHHESWLSGTRDNRTRLGQFGTLWMVHRGAPAGSDGVPMAMQRAERERAAAMAAGAAYLA